MTGQLISSGKNLETEVRTYTDRIYRRSLRPDELQRFAGRTHIPHMGPERLQNEAACLRFVRDRTNIPVPTVLEAYEDDDGSYVLVTSRPPGVQMHTLSDQDRAAVLPQVEIYSRAIHRLHSNRTGGPTGLVCPPYRATKGYLSTQGDPPGRYTPGALLPVFPSRTSIGEDFDFCHGDFSQHNVFVDRPTLKVVCVTGWEWAGFWPRWFDAPYFRSPRPSREQAGDPAFALENSWCQEFLRACYTGESLCRRRDAADRSQTFRRGGSRRRRLRRLLFRPRRLRLLPRRLTFLPRRLTFRRPHRHLRRRRRMASRRPRRTPFRRGRQRLRQLLFRRPRRLTFRRPNCEFAEDVCSVFAAQQASVLPS